MKKIFILYILTIVTIFSSFSITEVNDYYDSGLKEKTGTYGLASLMQRNILMGFTSVGNKNNYFEIGGKWHFVIDEPEMMGFYFVGDFLMTYKNIPKDTGGDAAYWGGFSPFYGEDYFGFRSKYLNAKFGWQYAVSSDAIYNHLILDDYSGSFFGLRVDSMFSRFFDFQFYYLILRPNKSSWLVANTVFNSKLITPTYKSMEDTTMYDGLYGKSLYFHKFNIRPLPWMRISLNESAYFLGENINPWYLNPLFPYGLMQGIDNAVKTKDGSRFNISTVDIKNSIDFNIGFYGWRTYGEFMLDDVNAEYLKFQTPNHPDRMSFILGAELRGYLFTRYFKMNPIAEYIIKNLYVNFEYGFVSRYVYSRDSNYNYEYVRAEYLDTYDPTHPPSQSDIDRVNRTGNFIGFMYGGNSDCIDFSIGWRSDLYNVTEYTAGYMADIYLDRDRKKVLPDRLIKIQLHYRHYRLGNGRNVIVPYYGNEHYTYDLDNYFDSDGDGNTSNDRTNRITDFLRVVLQEGNIFDINLYSDIFKIDRFVIGAESEFNFTWTTKFPGTAASTTDFAFRWDFGIVVTW
jgi:hypothetical protein